MNDFVKRARKAAPSRHPVRDVVRDSLADIRAGRANGLSWAAIFGQLKRDGKAVGKGPSSLRNAVRSIEALNAPVSVPVVVTSRPGPTPATPAANKGALGDTRFPSDWN